MKNKKQRPMAEERKKTEDKIKEIEAQILSNSKDAHFAKKLIQQLSGLYQMDKLIDVPIKDISDTIDMGANVLYRVRDGFVWECRGGMTTHVSMRMAKVCSMLDTIFALKHGIPKADEELSDSYATAVSYIMQCPIFSSLDERALFQNATAILKSYTEYCTENYTNAEAVDETTEDIKEDIQAEQAAAAIEQLADAPIPPEDIN